MLAPIVATLYYFAVKFAFVLSVKSVMGRTDLFENIHWGTHWTYRGIAEIISISFATFVAGGLAFGRERSGAIVGGVTISLWVVVALTLRSFGIVSPDLSEPWYQTAIDVALIFFAPLVGAYVVDAVVDLHKYYPTGFGGINRMHFVWLWTAAFFYALGLITPFGRIYSQQDTNIFALAIAFLEDGIPAIAILVPGYYGLTFLSGHHGSSMHVAGRNLIGVLVLIFGYFVGLEVQLGWYWTFEKIHEFIFL